MRVMVLEQKSAAARPDFDRGNFTRYSATEVAGLAKGVASILEKKALLTIERSNATRTRDGDAQFRTANEMSGQFNHLTEMRATLGTYQSRAFDWLKAIDRELTPLQDEAKALEALLSNYAGQEGSLPEKARQLEQNIADFKKDPRTVLIGGASTWARQMEDELNTRATDLQNLKTLVAYCIRKLAAVEAIDRDTAALAAEVRLRIGTWAKIGNNLASVDDGLKGNRIDWIDDDLVPSVQLDFAKDTEARAARYLDTAQPLGVA